MAERGPFSGNKYKKSAKESGFKKRQPSSLYWIESSLHPYQPSVSSGISRKGYYGHSRTGNDAGMQRKMHWETIMDSASGAPSQGDGTSPTSTSHGYHGSTSSSQNQDTSGSRRDSPSRSSHPPQSSSSSRAVPIAPRGPVTDPDDDDDGCRFKCQVEGCNQRFKHRSSRSRHKKNCHPPNPPKSR